MIDCCPCVLHYFVHSGLRTQRVEPKKDQESSINAQEVTSLNSKNIWFSHSRRGTNWGNRWPTRQIRHKHDIQLPYNKGVWLCGKSHDWFIPTFAPRMTDGEIDTCVIRRPQGTRGSASEKQCQMGKKEGATTDEKRKQRSGGLKQRSGGLKAAIWFRRRQGCRRMQVAIWSYFLVDSQSRLSKELVRPSLAWCLELASSRLKEGATTDDKRKQRSRSLKAATLVSVRKQRWAEAMASQRPRRPLVSWCYGAARTRFWRLATWNLEL